MALPKDPVMLLSFVNMKLRDCYSSLAAFCDDLEVDEAALCGALTAIGYAYDAAQNRFV